jgi:hypothetical protein
MASSNPWRFFLAEAYQACLCIHDMLRNGTVGKRRGEEKIERQCTFDNLTDLLALIA